MWHLPSWLIGLDRLCWPGEGTGDCCIRLIRPIDVRLSQPPNSNKFHGLHHTCTFYVESTGTRLLACATLHSNGVCDGDVIVAAFPTRVGKGQASSAPSAQTKRYPHSLGRPKKARPGKKSAPTRRGQAFAVALAGAVVGPDAAGTSFGPSAPPQVVADKVQGSTFRENAAVDVATAAVAVPVAAENAAAAAAAAAAAEFENATAGVAAITAMAVEAPLAEPVLQATISIDALRPIAVSSRSTLLSMPRHCKICCDGFQNTTPLRS